ncbi:hypothetical protein GYH30_052677 [Glycine max]|nr:hypothetical protein GYH30_052677 [Glycine max]
MNLLTALTACAMPGLVQIMVYIRLPTSTRIKCRYAEDSH